MRNAAVQEKKKSQAFPTSFISPVVLNVPSYGFVVRCSK